MKIGIITYHKGLNHGGYLQAYCLQQFLKNKGNNTFIIDYINPIQQKTEFEIFVKRWPKTKLWGLNHTYQNLIKYYKFNQAFKKFQLSKTITNSNFTQVLKEFDVIITGSDEIWNIKNPAFPENMCFFGEQVNNEVTTLISYAASIGNCTTDDINSQRITELLKRYHNISVRDANTLRAIENIGLAAKQVLDPTFLYDPYPDFKIRKPTNKKYLLTYVNSISNPEIEIIKDFAKKNNLIIISISYPAYWADYNDLKVGIDDWLSYFRYAEYIVTNTFHGLIFSIKNQIPVWIVSKSAKANKIDSLLQQLNMEKINHHVENHNELSNHFKIMWQSYNNIKNLFRSNIASSHNFLNNAIKKTPQGNN